MKLGAIKPAAGAKKNRKRVARGIGSGHGGTSCKGHKGQKARSGASIPAWFEGGQMPLQRRLPKRGFHNRFRVEKQIVNIRDLEKFDVAEVGIEALLERGVIKNLRTPVKLLGEGELKKAMKITVHACSKAAREIVEKAGGEVNIIG